MSEQELWDKFYNLLWEALIQRRTDGDSHFSEHIHKRIDDLVHYDDYFKERDKWAESSYHTYERYYENVRVKEQPYWQFVMRIDTEMWKEIVKAYPEFAVIEVLYA